MAFLAVTCLSASIFDHWEERQEDLDIALIKNFLSVLFDDSIPPKEVVEKYLVYGTTLEDEMKKTGFEIAKGHIELARLEKEKNQSWLVPNHRVASLTEYHVFPFAEYEHLNTLNLNGFDEEKLKKVYVLLNPAKDEILEYFLTEDGKIASFSLLVKGGDQAFFFGYGIEFYDYQIPYTKSVLGEIHFCFVRSDVNLTARDAKNAQGSPRFESIV